MMTLMAGTGLYIVLFLFMVLSAQLGDKGLETDLIDTMRHCSSLVMTGAA